MRDLILTTHFAKRYEKLIRKSSQFTDKITTIIEALQDNPFNPRFETHKLKGKLEKRYACTVAYDLRIIFEATVPLKKLLSSC